MRKNDGYELDTVFHMWDHLAPTRAEPLPDKTPHRGRVSKHNRAMRLNAQTAIVGDTVVLVPYRHVIRSGISYRSSR